MSTNSQPSDALRQIAEHGSFVQSLARRLVRDEAEAADMEQATWLVAIQGRVPEAGARAWLSQVLRRTVRRNYAQGQHRKGREAASAESWVQAKEGLATDEIVAREEALRRVTDAVLALDEPYRSTVLMRYHGGQSAKEIATQLGVPLATVRSRLERAMDRLRARLDADYGSDKQAWCLALISLGRLDVGVVGAGTAGATGATGAGWFAMAWKTKGWIVAGLLASGLGWFGWQAWDSANGAGNHSPQRSSVLAEVDRGLQPQSTVSVQSGILRRTVPAKGPGPSSVPLPVSSYGHVEVLAVRPSGEPAPSMWIDLESPFGPPSERVRQARTDDQGRCSFAAVPPGELHVFGERGGLADAEVRAGETTVVRLSLPAGLRVQGRVSDAFGAGVPNADLWLFRAGITSHGVAVAQSAADGSFVLQDVGPACRIGAMAPGRASSPEVNLKSWDQAALDAEGIVLVLGAASGAARIRLLDHHGSPVASALVRLVLPVPRLPQNPGIEESVDSLKPAYRTDALGELELPSMAPGILILHITAAGFAPLVSELRIEAGGIAAADFQLHRAVQVEGRVHARTGEPVAGVQVFLVKPLVDHFSIARTDAKGHYRLEDLPSGPVVIGVKDPGERWAPVSEAFDLRTGETRAWNPTLDQGRTISGTLVSGGSGRVAERALRARTAGAEFPFAFATSDSLGAFSFRECPSGPLELDLIGDEGMQGLVVQTVHLRSDEQQARFVLGDRIACTGEIRLRLAEGGTVALRRSPGGADGIVVEGPGESGEIVFSGLCPGGYDLEVRQSGYPRRFERGIELVAGQVLDLGLRKRGPMGALGILVDGRPAHMSATFLSFVIERSVAGKELPARPLSALERAGTERVLSLGMQEDASGLPLAPGTYLVRANGNAGMASQRQVVRIHADDHAQVEFQSAPGVLVSLECKPSQLTAQPLAIRAALDDGRGPCIVQSLNWNPWTQTFAMYAQVRPGTHTFAFQVEGHSPVEHLFQVAPNEIGGAGQGAELEAQRVVVSIRN